MLIERGFAWPVGLHVSIQNTLKWRPSSRRLKQKLKYGDARSILVMKMGCLMGLNPFDHRATVLTTPEVK